MVAGQFAVTVFWDVNPAYDLPQSDDGDSSAWRAAMAKVPWAGSPGPAPGRNRVDVQPGPAHQPLARKLERFRNQRRRPSPCSSRLWRRFTRPCRAMRFSCAAWPRWAAQWRRPMSISSSNAGKKKSRPRKVRSHSRVSGTPACTTASSAAGPEPLSACRLDGEACTRAATRTARASSSAGFELVLATDPRVYDGRYANKWMAPGAA